MQMAARLRDNLLSAKYMASTNFIKIKGTKIFDGYDIVHGKVLVLTPDGSVAAIINMEEAGDDIQQVEGLLSPGFINCHCHLELSHMKGIIAAHTGLVNFVGDVNSKRKISEAIILQAVADAETEMLNNGIVAVGDICNKMYTIEQKRKGNIYYRNFIEVLGFDPLVADRNFETFKNIFEAFSSNLPNNKTSLTLHAPYSVSAALWKKVVHYPGNNLISIHNQETQDETLWFKNKQGDFAIMYQRMNLDTGSFTPSGKSSLQTYGNNFLPHQSLLLVHNVFTTKKDIEFATTLTNPVFWCFCANANEYISNCLPDINLFVENNCNIVLGTDSLASNHQLSIWSEIQTIQKKYPNLSLQTMLQWATINGAKALQLEAIFGSFEKGKKPGVVVINEQVATNLKL